MDAQIVTLERLKNLLDYNAEDGLFRWKERTSNRICVGDIAGVKRHALGYISISIDRHLYKAHRLAWLFVHGCWPNGDVDHINGDRTDNRLANLRDVTRSTNLQNQRRARSNNVSSGLLGVSWAEHRNKWRAVIKINGASKQLAYCATKEEAHQVYLEAKRKHHEGCTI